MPDAETSQNLTELQALLACFAKDYLKEKKQKRIWKWFFRTFILALILGFLYQIMFSHGHSNASRHAEHIGLVDVKGTIAEGAEASAENFAKSLDSAYESHGLKALILRIDSPGGSPVQADYIYNTLNYYKKKYPQIKTYAVCVDACASAAYYIAAGADEIYANPSSIVGSIGVLYNGFGFVDTLEKVGMTRRLMTAGKNKGFLDPFSPVNAEQDEKMKNMLDIIHQQFIAKVKEGRGDRLKANDETFSGLFWTGQQAKTMGLIDGFASSGQLARDVIKLNKFIDYSYKESVFERVAKQLGEAMIGKLPEALGMKPSFK